MKTSMFANFIFFIGSGFFFSFWVYFHMIKNKVTASIKQIKA